MRDIIRSNVLLVVTFYSHINSDAMDFTAFQVCQLICRITLYITNADLPVGIRIKRSGFIERR